MKSRSVESYQFVGLIFGLMHVKRLTIPVLVRCVCQSNHLTRGKVVFESSVALSSSWKRNVQSSSCREEKVEGFYENLSTTRGTLNSRTVGATRWNSSFSQGCPWQRRAHERPRHGRADRKLVWEWICSNKSKIASYERGAAFRHRERRVSLSSRLL